jgi:hypothetical protein
MSSAIMSVEKSITNVEIEFYHVFPKDSANPPSGFDPKPTSVVQGTN